MQLDAVRPAFAAFVPVQPLMPLEAHRPATKHMLVAPCLTVRPNADGFPQQVQHFRGPGCTRPGNAFAEVSTPDEKQPGSLQKRRQSGERFLRRLHTRRTNGLLREYASAVYPLTESFPPIGTR